MPPECGEDMALPSLPIPLGHLALSLSVLLLGADCALLLLFSVFLILLFLLNHSSSSPQCPPYFPVPRVCLQVGWFCTAVTGTEKLRRRDILGLPLVPYP